MSRKKFLLLANFKKIQGKFTGGDGRIEKKTKGAEIMFRIPHLLVLLATGILVWRLGTAARQAGRERVLGWLKVCAVLSVLFDPIYWAWEFWQYGQIHLATTLPLYLCSLFCMMLPVAVFSKREMLRQMAAANVCTMGMLGGVLGLVFNVYLNRYPFFHFVPVRSLLYHILMVAAATLLWCGGVYRPRSSDRVLCFVPVATLVGVSLVCNRLFGWDYCYTAGGIGTPLEMLSRMMPIWTFLLVLYGGLWLLMQVLFYRDFYAEEETRFVIRRSRV